MNNKGQISAGLITGLIFGIASLVIGVIIAFVVVSTLTDANLLSDNRESFSVVNESGWLNSTTYTLDEYSTSRAIPSSFSITAAYNGTSSQLIPSTNYSLSSGIVSNTSDAWENVTFTYTYSLYNVEEYSVTGLNSNFTTGVDNVSSKLPTALAIAAVVLILGVLVLLVAAWQRMRLGGGSI